MLGPPAAGKSTVANPILEAYRAKLIDPDEMKQLIPEFDGGRNAGGVHRESSHLVEELMLRAVERGENIVVPMVGKTRGSLEQDIQDLKDAGYDVHLVINELPAAKAAWRAYVRFHDENRYVSFHYILGEVQNRPQENFQALKDDPRVSTYQRFDNDVPYRTSPVLLERSDDAPELPGLPHEVERLGEEEAGAPGQPADAGQRPEGAEAPPGRFRERGAEEVAALAPELELEPGQAADRAEVQDELFGGSTLVGGQEQTEMGLEGGAASLTAAERQAKQTLSLLQGKIERGHASKAEVKAFEDAYTLLRRNDKLDAAEVGARARDLAEESRTLQFEDTGDLFALAQGQELAGGVDVAPLTPEERSPESRSLEELQDHLEQKYGIQLRLYQSHGHTIELSRVEVPEGERGRGLGTRALEEVLAWADLHNKTLWLSVAREGNEGRLREWYKRHGFVENRGRNKDYALSRYAEMYRVPQGKDVSPLDPGWSDAQLASARLPEVGGFATATDEEVGRFLSRAEESEETVPSRREIQEYLEKALNVPVKTGRFPRRSPKGSLGIYKAPENVIRLGTHGDIVTLAHELGHRLQQLFFSSPDGKLYEDHFALMPQEMQDELTELSRGISGGGLREGWAEFWRRYLDRPEVLPERAPALLGYVQERLDNEFPHIRNVLEKGAEMWRSHREGGELARIESQISVGERDPGLSAAEAWRRFRTGLLDRFEPIRQVVQDLTDGNPNHAENAEALARLVAGSTGLADHWLEKGQLSFETGKAIPGAKPLKAILEPVVGNLDTFRTYTVVRRAQELQERDIETGMREADVAAALDQLEDRYGETFRPVFDELVEYQDNLLRYLVDAGVMSEETFTAIKEKNQAYVPFMRVMDQQGASGISGALGHLFSPVRKIQGSGRQIVDPLESIVKATYEYMQLGAKQEVSRALGEVAQRLEAGEHLEAIDTPIRRLRFSLGEVEGQLANIVGQETLDEIRDRAREEFEERTEGMDEQEIRARGLKPYDPAEELLAIFRPGDLFGKANVISVLENGERQYYEVSEELWEALQGLDVEHAPLVARWLGVPARTLRAGATLAPEFQLRNPIRDQVMAGIQSEYGYVPFVDMTRGIFHLLGKTETYWAWKAGGGERSSLLALDRRQMQRAVAELERSGGATNVIKTELDALRLFGRALAETATLNLRQGAETAIEGVTTALDPLARLSALMEDATRVGEFA
ncbi:MAG: GNAT family N-acetyltransferase, partial [Longimicrobiales bacterium]